MFALAFIIFNLSFIIVSDMSIFTMKEVHLYPEHYSAIKWGLNRFPFSGIYSKQWPASWLSQHASHYVLLHCYSIISSTILIFITLFMSHLKGYEKNLIFYKKKDYLLKLIVVELSNKSKCFYIQKILWNFSFHVNII